jgi:hypothetical protein
MTETTHIGTRRQAKAIHLGHALGMGVGFKNGAKAIFGTTARGNVVVIVLVKANATTQNTIGLRLCVGIAITAHNDLLLQFELQRIDQTGHGRIA